MKVCGLFVVFLVIGAHAQPSTELSELQAMLLRGRDLQVSGRHGESRKHFEKVLRMAQAIGPAETSVVWAWLGSTYFELHRLAESQQAFVRCLELRGQTWGARNERDPDHARVLTSLGAVELAMHRFRQAEERLNAASKIWRLVPEQRTTVDFGQHLQNLAMLKYEQRRYADSAQGFREVIALLEEILFVDDRRLARARAGLATTLSLLGSHDEADAVSRLALTAFEGKLEQEPFVAAELLSIRASVLRKAKRGREAQQLEALSRDFLRKTELQHTVDASTLGRP